MTTKDPTERDGRCGQCGTKMEDSHLEHERWCSSCWSSKVRRIRKESPVEDGDLVRYDGAWAPDDHDGTVFRATTAPQQCMFLIPPGVEYDHYDDSPWPLHVDVRELEPVDEAE